MGGGSEISKASASFVEEGEECLQYYCKLESPLMTSFNNRNPGRRFNGCGRYKVDGKKGCEFFKWVDEPVKDHEKKIIRGLLRRIDAMKTRERFLLGVIGFLICLVVVLVAVILTK